MTARKFPLPGPFGGIASARGMLLTGCALALCGAAVIARTVSGAPEAAPERLSVVPVAIDLAAARAPEAALVLVPMPGADEAPAAAPVADRRDPLDIDMAEAARLTRARAAQADSPARVVRNVTAAVPAAPRPIAPMPGPRPTAPLALAALPVPDAAPPAMRAAPVPDFLADRPLRRAAAPAAAPDRPIASVAAAPRGPVLPRLAEAAPPRRPAADPAGTVLAAAPAPMPRPERVERASRRATVASAPSEDTVLAAAPAPAPAQPPAARAPAPVAEPVLGPRVADARLCRKSLARTMPSRRPGAAEGTAFFAALGGLSGTERDARIVAELARGNMPSDLRGLRPVRLTGTDAAGQPAEIVICVTPDYLALGSDRDHVRVPLGLPAARQIAARFDMVLPTPRMVDAIWAQSDVRLSPAPMPPGPQMSSTDYFLRHNATIEGQLGRAGGLVAGHKKDVVIASRMQNAPGRVAIYGWHRRSGAPIQPVSTVHGATYSDYSHGIRLVARTAYVNGRAADLDDLLTTARYARILNPDGPLPAPVIQLASR